VGRPIRRDSERTLTKETNGHTVHKEEEEEYIAVTANADLVSSTSFFSSILPKEE
jgi:hypothetical protein